MMDNLFNEEELEARYTAFKVECERIRNRLDAMEETLNKEEAADKTRKGFVWRLFKGVAA